MSQELDGRTTTSARLPDLRANADPETTPLDALRWMLERRALDKIRRVTASHVRVLRAGDVILSEVAAFRETEPELLRELVVNLLAALHSRNLEAALWISGDRHRLRYFLGQYRVPGQSPSDSAFLRTCAEGFFKGADINPVPVTEGAHLLQALCRANHGALICGIPSERDGTDVETRLDEALEAIASRKFDLFIRFTPVPSSQELPEEPGLEPLQDDLAAIVNAARALESLQETEEVATAFTESFERSRQTVHEKQTIRATSESEATTHMRQTTGNAVASTVGAALGALVGLATGPAAPLVTPALASAGASIGGNIAGRGQRSSEAGRYSENRGSQSESQASKAGVRDEKTRTGTTQMTFARAGRQAEQIEESAELHLQRVRQGRSVGAFRTTVVVAAESSTDVDLVAHTLAGALRGDRTFLEPLRIIPAEDEHSIQELLAAATSASPLRWNVQFPALGGGGAYLSSLLTSEEAALWLRPPSHPIAGVSVKPSTRFHRTVPRADPGQDIPIGDVLVDGRTGAALYLRLEDLRRHCFIAGTTGSGKTTTVRTILRGLHDIGIPFMLVEPAKSEYREIFDDLRSGDPSLAPVRLVAGSPKAAQERQLAFNPFRPVAGIPVDRYVGQLRVLLQSCFSMQESLPQILEALIDEAYKVCGLSMGQVMPEDYKGYLPTFRSMLTPQFGFSPLIDSVIARLGYGHPASETLRAALLVRLESFTKGIKKEMFDGQTEIDWNDLLRRPCFVELSDVSDPYVRRFILGALMLRISSVREAEARRAQNRNQSLRHVIVLEEAHHFLREPNGVAPGAELVRHGNELLADALAELRSYGQGILIADQSPAELAPAVLRNTLVKIAHGLMYEQDCRAMGDAMGIDPKNQPELRRLRTGECIACGPDFDGPVHARIRRSPTTAA